MNTNLAQAWVTAARAFADTLEAEIAKADGVEADADGTLVATASGGPVAYDPLVDATPMKADPVGSPEQRRMAWLAFLAAVRAINVREGRGATPAEVRKYAMKAGYPDGRAVSGFSNEGGATFSADGTRFVNEGGLKWLGELSSELDIVLPADLI